jgi:hypothetical protein
MVTMGRCFLLPIAVAIAGAFLGCPSLGDIDVGTSRDAGTSAREAGPDRVVDVTPREARTKDAPRDEKACTDDPESDPKNCGRCSHDCMGGACAGGVCQPYPILSGVIPYGIAVTNGTVYLTTGGGNVEKCNADNCLATLAELATEQEVPEAITTDTSSVYWTNAGFIVDGGNAGSIMTCGLAGCPGGVPTVLAPLEDDPQSIVVSSSAVYWTNTYGGLVRTCTIGGCGHSPTTLATDPTTLSGVAIDATSIYWAESALGNIIKCPLTGCTTLTPFVSGQGYPAELVVANETLYWSAGGAIMSCPTSGCGGAPHVFAKDQVGSYSIASDATNLYWTLFLGGMRGKVLSCALSGCATPTVLADMQKEPMALAVDDTSVYWADSNELMRVMK